MKAYALTTHKCTIIQYTLKVWSPADIPLGIPSIPIGQLRVDCKHQAAEQRANQLH